MKDNNTDTNLIEEKLQDILMAIDMQNYINNDSIISEEECQYVIAPETKSIEYKYNEGKLLQEITRYINKTYSEHYAQGNIQSTEIAIDRGRGLGFCLGNVDKYSGRYGQKGTPSDWRKDLLKVIHYGIISLHIHDLQHKTSK